MNLLGLDSRLIIKLNSSGSQPSINSSECNKLIILILTVKILGLSFCLIDLRSLSDIVLLLVLLYIRKDEGFSSRDFYSFYLKDLAELFLEGWFSVSKSDDSSSSSSKLNMQPIPRTQKSNWYIYRFIGKFGIRFFLSLSFLFQSLQSSTHHYKIISSILI